MSVLSNTYTSLERLIRREINYHRLMPTNMLLYLTYRCTSQCKSCTMWKRKTTSGELSFPEWKRVVDMAKECGYPIKNVEMFGGDALMRKDVLAPLTAYCKQQGIPEVDLATNGNLLDDEMSTAIVDAGMSTVYVSLDGVGPLHDRVRGGAGAFERTQKGIKALIKARMHRKTPKITLNCTISALNINGFDKVLPYAQDIGADKVALEYVGEFPEYSIQNSVIGKLHPDPYYVLQNESILLNKEQALYLKTMVKRMKETARGMSVYMNSRNIDILSVDNMTKGSVGHRRCYVCRYLISVDPYGNLVPCPFYGNYHLGNVRDAHLGQLWGNERHREFIRYADEGRFEICKHCILGVERNRTLFQAIEKVYYSFRKKGMDEP